MKFLTHRLQFFILALWIPAVMIIFKLINDRAWASIVAGIGFIFWPALFLILEIYSKNLKSKLHIVGCLQFLILSAIPIFLLRILNWGINFNELSLFGVSAVMFHQFSNISYLIMTIAIAYSSHEDQKNTY